MKYGNGILSLIAVIILFLFGVIMCGCGPRGPKIYFVGDTVQCYDSAITLNSASRLDAITIDENVISAEEGCFFLVLNVTVTAKENITLSNQRFMIAVIEIIADAKLSMGLNDGIDYLCDFILVNRATITFNVVFLLPFAEDCNYSARLHEASFSVCSSVRSIF